MSHLIVGTAGHIDHGKSALVRALTGIDPDRLAEEKRRGITIDLGFADLDLGSSRTLSFVDVPGHEKFVRHMVAGATGIDAVLFVIAADQGVQPQTREHLDICSLLEVRRGVVALSKSDLVDQELLEVVSLEVQDLCAGTFLDGTAIVPVSARTGEGLDVLRDTLGRLFDEIPQRSPDGVARLPIDRSFVLRGFGAVVTGTLVSGSLVEGQEIEILPGHRKGRIRGLQVHGRSIPRAVAGQRTAVNLQGLDSSDVPRGATLAAPGSLLTTRRAWARMGLLPDAPERLAKGGPVRFHQGTCERSARIRVLGTDRPGSFRVELLLGQETVLVPGDRFILRRPSPVNTVGGGTIVDVRPPPAREATVAAFAAEALAPESAVRARLARSGDEGAEATKIAAELGWTSAQTERVLASLEASAEVVHWGPRWLDHEVSTDLERRVLDALEHFHGRKPLRSGMSREELRTAAAIDTPQEVWRELLERLNRRNEIRLDGEWVADARHQVVLDPAEQNVAHRIERLYVDAGLDPPETAKVLATGEAATLSAILDLLVARGTLVRIQDGRLLHANALASLKAKLRDYAIRSRTIDVASFKELAGVTRKNAIPLLEHLDTERTTRRMGNVREILLSAPE